MVAEYLAYFFPSFPNFYWVDSVFFIPLLLSLWPFGSHAYSILILSVIYHQALDNYFDEQIL